MTILNTQNLFTSQHVIAPYDIYNVQREYYWNSGIVHLPVAAPSAGGVGGSGGPGANRPACEIAQASAPYGSVRITFQSERLGAAPLAPSPDQLDSNLVFKEGWFRLEAPQLQDDGRSKVVRASGEYHYYAQRPIWFQDGLRAGATPYDSTPASVNIYGGDNLSTGL